MSDVELRGERRKAEERDLKATKRVEIKTKKTYSEDEGKEITGQTSKIRKSRMKAVG